MSSGSIKSIKTGTDRARFLNFLTACASRRSTFFALLVASLSGCTDPSTIEVDLSADKPRFTIDHTAWGWPSQWPRVNDFALASEEDGLLWEIRATDPDGCSAHQLAIVYGDVPTGFYQVAPGENARPPRLRCGRTYYVGATGSSSVYRAVFALPADRLGVPAQPDFLHDVQPIDDQAFPSR